MPRKGRITQHFFMSEFECKCGKCTMPDDVRLNIIKLVQNVLQPLRDFLGVPIRITSGYRCPAYNKTRRGASRNSQHMKGTAADLRIGSDRRTPHINANHMYWLLDHYMRAHRLGPGGVGRYPTFTHVDIRPTKRAVRW